MTFLQIASRFSVHPQRLFLVDGLGALTSAFWLGFILPQWESFFGIPRSTLYFLALLPVGFAIYDLFCFIKIKERMGLFLKVMAYLNIAYCGLSLALAFYHYPVITYFGWIYLLLKISLVLALAKLELQTAKITLTPLR